MAQTTKRALAASLKHLLLSKPLDKIRVIDIVEDCEVNRQTFYYHFKDIYDLVEWMYVSEATKALNGNKTYETWQQGYEHIFEYVKENKVFVINTYHSMSREVLERYLYGETYQLLIGVVNEQAEGMDVRDEDKAFIAHFYKYAFVGLMLEWIGSGMKTNPGEIIQNLNILIQGDIKKALEKYQNK